MEALLDPLVYLLALLGVVIGLVCGILPGFGLPTAAALGLPLAYALANPIPGIAWVVGLFLGSLHGVRMQTPLRMEQENPQPGEKDAFEMSENGAAERAQHIGLAAGAIGGILASLLLLALAIPLAKATPTLGATQTAMLIIFALACAGLSTTATRIKGMLALLLGMLASSPGPHPVTGLVRMNGDIPYFNHGVHVIPVMLGIFVVGQSLIQLLKKDYPVIQQDPPTRNLTIKIANILSSTWAILRGSTLGMLMGMIPGVGFGRCGNSAVNLEKYIQKGPENFDRGSGQAFRSENSSKHASSISGLIPLLAFGIPSSAAGAMLFPILNSLPAAGYPAPTGSFIVAALLACIFAAIIPLLAQTLTNRPLLSLLNTSSTWWIPLAIGLAVLGAYSAEHRLFDVWIMLGFGLVGALMRWFALPITPWAIGFVLAPPLEKALGTAIIQTQGSYVAMLKSPLALTFFLLALATLFRPWIIAGVRLAVEVARFRDPPPPGDVGDV